MYNEFDNMHVVAPALALRQPHSIQIRHQSPTELARNASCKDSAENTATTIEHARRRKAKIQMCRGRLIPDLQDAVPRPGGDCHPVVRHTQTTHPVVVTSQHTYQTNIYQTPNNISSSTWTEPPVCTTEFLCLLIL